MSSVNSARIGRLSESRRQNPMENRSRPSETFGERTKLVDLRETTDEDRRENEHDVREDCVASTTLRCRQSDDQEHYYNTFLSFEFHPSLGLFNANTASGAVTYWNLPAILVDVFRRALNLQIKDVCFGFESSVGVDDLDQRVWSLSCTPPVVPAHWAHA